MARLQPGSAFGHLPLHGPARLLRMGHRSREEHSRRVDAEEGGEGGGARRRGGACAHPPADVADPPLVAVFTPRRSLRPMIAAALLSALARLPAHVPASLLGGVAPRAALGGALTRICAHWLGERAPDRPRSASRPGSGRPGSGRPGSSRPGSSGSAASRRREAGYSAEYPIVLEALHGACRAFPPAALCAMPEGLLATLARVFGAAAARDAAAAEGDPAAAAAAAAAPAAAEPPRAVAERVAAEGVLFALGGGLNLPAATAAAAAAATGDGSGGLLADLLVQACPLVLVLFVHVTHALRMHTAHAHCARTAHALRTHMTRSRSCGRRRMSRRR